MAKGIALVGPGKSSAGVSAKERCYRYLRDEILSGETGQIASLTEEGVAATLGVSRTPVREAFQRLEAEGLITLVPRKGAVVNPVTEREVREVMEIRQLIECWSADRGGDGDERKRNEIVERLSALHAEQAELARRGDVTAFIECDRRFHQEIVRSAGNQLLLDLYERLRDRQLGMGVRAVLSDPERTQAVYEEHGRIVEAFRGGGSQEVEAALMEHLNATFRILVDSRSRR